jgi:G1/S-specific cyclin PLC1
MATSGYLSMDQLNKSALEQFVYQPVGRDMISYLALAAQSVITCDDLPARNQQLPPTPPKTPEPEQSLTDDKKLPSVEDFITKLVVSSNVQVPTLMSSLVYLNRLKSRLQPQARGIRCTAHRIFLASLILAAKYLNDSSPKNKHWANYTNMTTEYYQFGFNRQEVNTMEKQLLFLLEWDLRISEDDLYRELDFFLEPLRQKIAQRRARKIHEREEMRRQREMSHASTRNPSPASSRVHSRSRNGSVEHYRSASGGSISPPELMYSSSASSYSSSSASSRRNSQSTTPMSEPDTCAYNMSQGSLYDSPVQIVMDHEGYKAQMPNGKMLPYEISVEQYQQLQTDECGKKRPRRGVWGRILGATR